MVMFNSRPAAYPLLRASHAMAFFNLTHLGSQDPFRTATGHVVHDTRVPPRAWAGEDEESEEREEERGSKSEPTVERVEKESTSEPQIVSRVKVQFPEKGEGGQTTPPQAPLSHTTSMYSSEGGEHSWHSGSHVKYTDLLRKHQRNPQGVSVCVSVSVSVTVCV